MPVNRYTAYTYCISCERLEPSIRLEAARYIRVHPRSNTGAGLRAYRNALFVIFRLTTDEDEKISAAVDIPLGAPGDRTYDEAIHFAFSRADRGSPLYEIMAERVLINDPLSDEALEAARYFYETMVDEPTPEEEPNVVQRDDEMENLIQEAQRSPEDDSNDVQRVSRYARDPVI